MFGASKSGQVPSTPDPQFNYVTALLHGDGTNGAQNNTFLDSSTNNFTITRNGTPTQGSFSPYGTLWSNYFDGSSYLTAGTGSITITGDFTIEFWFNSIAVSSGYDFYFIDASNTINNFAIEATGNVLRWVYGASVVASASFTPTADTWYHVALVRSGSGTNNCTMYVNGTSLWQATKTGSINNAPGPWIIGAAGNGGTKYTGYISNLRIVNGTAVYTGNFTPSLTPLTAITNTYLLTCQSNRFVDNSGNNNTIAIGAGTPSVQRFNPFLPTSSQAYSTSVYGGSGYFNGSTDYLQLSSNSAFNCGTGNFTLQFWIYRPVGVGVTPITRQSSSSGWNNIQWYLTTDTSGNTTFVVSDGGSPYNFWANGVIAGNAWTHCAIVRSSGTWYYYINGVSQSLAVGTGYSFSMESNATGQPLNIGGFAGWGLTTGYLCDVKFAPGQVTYPSGTTFTPPTLPATATTGTAVLTNFQNAGIYDNAMINDLITVGSTQVSTSVKKYGTGSILLNGTTDYLTFPNVGNPQFNFGTGDFTIEFWINSTDTAGGIITPLNSYGSSYWGLLMTSSTFYWQYSYGVSNLYNNSASSILNGAWHHVAIVRYIGTNKMYFDGVAQANSASDTTSYITPSSSNYCIGYDYSGGGNTGYLAAYIDDFRVTKGYARYTSNFTPPTTAFPNY